MHATPMPSCHLGVTRTLKMLETLLLVGWYGSLHEMVGAPLPKMSGT